MTQKRTRRTASERTEIVERWQRSGQPAREFAAQAGLNTSLLYLWRRQQKAALKREPKVRERKPAFSELRLSTMKPPAGHLEVVSRSGRVVRVHGDVDVRAFERILKAVEGC